MENLLVLLPSRPQSIPVRYGVTTLIVLVCFALKSAQSFNRGFSRSSSYCPEFSWPLSFLIVALAFTPLSSAPRCAMQCFLPPTVGCSRLSIFCPFCCSCSSVLHSQR